MIVTRTSACLANNASHEKEGVLAFSLKKTHKRFAKEKRTILFSHDKGFAWSLKKNAQKIRKEETHKKLPKEKTHEKRYSCEAFSCEAYRTRRDTRLKKTHMRGL